MLGDFLYSVEDVWLIWLGGCGVLALLIYRSLRSPHWKSVTGFLKSEEGSSYALNYVMTFPAYLITVCFVIQGTMILIVKIGVMHSAHMAARSAVVWRPAHPTSDSAGLQQARDKAKQAAVLAMVPYASGLAAHQSLLIQYNPASSARAYAYDKLYRQLAKHSEAKDCLADSAFVQRKYKYASAMTSVRLLQHTNRFNSQLKVEVTYRSPIHIPGTRWIFADSGFFSNYRYRTIRAQVMLPLETAESPDGRLGIDYDSSQL